MLFANEFSTNPVVNDPHIWIFRHCTRVHSVILRTREITELDNIVGHA